MTPKSPSDDVDFTADQMAIGKAVGRLGDAQAQWAQDAAPFGVVSVVIDTRTLEPLAFTASPGCGHLTMAQLFSAAARAAIGAHMQVEMAKREADERVGTRPGIVLAKA